MRARRAVSRIVKLGDYFRRIYTNTTRRKQKTTTMTTTMTTTTTTRAHLSKHNHNRQAYLISRQYTHMNKRDTSMGKAIFFNFNARMGIVTILHDSFVCLYASSTKSFVELACVNRKEKQSKCPPECPFPVRMFVHRGNHDLKTPSVKAKHA